MTKRGSPAVQVFIVIAVVGVFLYGFYRYHDQHTRLKRSEESTDKLKQKSESLSAQLQGITAIVLLVKCGWMCGSTDATVLVRARVTSTDLTPALDPSRSPHTYWPLDENVIFKVGEILQSFLEDILQKYSDAVCAYDFCIWFLHASAEFYVNVELHTYLFMNVY